MSNQEYGVGVRGNPTVKIKSVRFTGSTAVVAGQGLCYDDNTNTTATGGTGAATDALGTRNTDVEVPSASNFMAFAGVAVRAYAAVTGGQDIMIYEPGSICPVLCINSLIGTLNTVVSSTRLRLYAGASVTGSAGNTAVFTQYNVANALVINTLNTTVGVGYGRGFARALQTVNAATNTGALVMCELEVGACATNFAVAVPV